MTVDWLTARAEDTARHIADLGSGTYEGAESRSAREEIFRRAFDLTTPVALDVLESVSQSILHGTGRCAARSLESDGRDGLWGRWELTWPLLEQAQDRITNLSMPPVRIAAIYPIDFSHGHLALLRANDPPEPILAWPLQVTDQRDAERQRPILWAIAEGEVHERIFRANTNWRVIPESEAPKSWGRIRAARS